MTIKRKENIKRYKSGEKFKACKKRYRKSKAGKASMAAYQKRWYKKNKHKLKVYSKTNKEIKVKRICEVLECDKIGIKHHEDYNRPLDVNWLCLKHHGIYHSRNITLENFISADRG